MEPNAVFGPMSQEGRETVEWGNPKVGGWKNVTVLVLGSAGQTSVLIKWK